MNKTPFEIKSDHLPLFQCVLRHYIGDNQYEDNYFMQIYDNNKVIKVLTNDNLKLFLSGKQSINLDDMSKTYTIYIGYQYKYNFIYYNEPITVVLYIYKRYKGLINEITKYSWNKQKEEFGIQCDNTHFFNELMYALQLKTPVLEHYHLKDDYVDNLIEVINKYNSGYYNKVYNDYKNDKDVFVKDANIFKQNVNKFNLIQPVVFQISDFKNIQKDYISTIKIDGIRTLVIIENNVITCCQNNGIFRYKHNINIEGKYIFDCELCNGILHIFDCYNYNGKNCYKKNYVDRIKLINEFAEKYPIFVGITYTPINSPIDVIDGISIPKNILEFYTSSNFSNIFQQINALTHNKYTTLYSDFSQNNYLDFIEKILQSKISNVNDIKEYYRKLQQYLQGINDQLYKSICDQLNNFIKHYLDDSNRDYYNTCIKTYSPVIIYKFLCVYMELGFKDDKRKLRNIAINFVNQLRNNGIDIPVSSSIIIEQMYTTCEYPKDGVIFTKNDVIKFSESYHKWKPRNMLSVDMSVVFKDMYDDYVTVDLCYRDKDKIECKHKINLEYNNFNKTLPKCENGDIVQSNNIVEIVPYFDNNEYKYNLMRVRYDKILPNAARTCDNIFNLQKDFINIF